MAIDEAKLQQLLGKMLGEVGAAMGIGLVLLGDKFGLYKALASTGPLTSGELASRTGTAARYVQEWAAAQAAGGYINFDSATERFSISPEQALILADENGPAFFPGMSEIAAARDLPKVETAFRTGGGLDARSREGPSANVIRIVGEQRARAREHIFRRVAAEVPKHLAAKLDDLLMVGADENVSGLQAIKTNPSKPSVDAMLRLVGKLNAIEATGVLGAIGRGSAAIISGRCSIGCENHRPLSCASWPSRAGGRHWSAFSGRVTAMPLIRQWICSTSAWFALTPRPKMNSTSSSRISARPSSFRSRP